MLTDFIPFMTIKVEEIKMTTTPADPTATIVPRACKLLSEVSSQPFEMSLYPLHKLLQKVEHWAWSNDYQTSFNKVKSMISTGNVPIPYKSKLPLLLDCDVFAYGL